MASKRRESIKDVVARLIKETREAWAATGSELSQEALGEKVREHLAMVWPHYIVKDLGQFLGVDVGQMPIAQDATVDDDEEDE